MPPEECLDKLEQLILDENELVTYKLLSKELKIHVNEAKKCLYEFLMTHNSKGEVKLFAHYFLSGFIVKDGFRSQKVIIVSEEKLEQIKKEFDEVVSIHIYSVNKGGCRDASSMYNSQSWCKKWAEEHREYSAIKHPNIKIQAPVITKAEVKKSEAKVLSSKPLPVKTKNEGISSMFQNNKKEMKSNLVSTNSEKPASDIANDSENPVADSESANCAKSGSESKDPKKSTLSSLWQKLEDKTKDGKNENSKLESKGKNKSLGSSKTVGKNNIMSMFSKQAERNAVNPVKKLPDPVSSPEKTKNNTPPKTERETDKVVTVKNKSKSSQRKTKRSLKPVSDNDSEEDVKPKKKKHRRICTMDDSDSESENEEERDRAQCLLTSTENTVVPTALSDDSEEPIPPTPPVLPNKGKKKVWKSVQKTYQDEDGFLVAKQEKVLVSGSDSDENPLPEKNSIKKEEPKQNTFLYRKQASLTSFFKQR